MFMNIFLPILIQFDLSYILLSGFQILPPILWHLCSWERVLNDMESGMAEIFLGVEAQKWISRGPCDHFILGTTFWGFSMGY